MVRKQKRFAFRRLKLEKIIRKKERQMKRRAGADRRSGQDRRVAHDLLYFSEGGVERRKCFDRRQSDERRSQWARISSWSSARSELPKPQERKGEGPVSLRERALK
jgi:hypothetical protein